MTTILDIPQQVQRHIVRFLHPSDAISVSQTCHALHNELALSWLNPPSSYRQRLLRYSKNETESFGDEDESSNTTTTVLLVDDDDDDASDSIIVRDAVLESTQTIANNVSSSNNSSSSAAAAIQCSFLLPVYLSDSRIHSLTLTCKWNVSGDDPLKFQRAIWIVASPKENNAEALKDFGHKDNRIVYESTVGSRESQSICASWVPQPDKEVYHVWVLPGGGGYILWLEDILLHNLVYDDARRCFRRAYNALRASSSAFSPRRRSKVRKESRASTIHTKVPFLQIDLNRKGQCGETASSNSSSHFYDDYNSSVCINSNSSVYSFDDDEYVCYSSADNNSTSKRKETFNNICRSFDFMRAVDELMQISFTPGRYGSVNVLL